METTSTIRERRSYARNQQIMKMPNLIDVQRDSYGWFLENGLHEIFEDVFPIQDFTGSLVLEYVGYSQGKPKYELDECEERDVSYAAPLKVGVRLINKETGELKEQEVFMGDFPLMTENGTFIINGAKRVVVSQLVRSPGAYFSSEMDLNGVKLFGSTLIPNRGAWLEFESDASGCVFVRIDRMRKFPATILIRSLGYETNEEILALFDGHEAIAKTLEKDPAENVNQALLEIYRRLRPGEPPTVDSARSLLFGFFFDHKRYDLGNVGRYKVQKKLQNGIGRFQREDGLVWNDEAQAYIDGELANPRLAGRYIRHLTQIDIVSFLRYFLEVMDGKHEPDDIDHLGNRRLRSVGELLQNQFRIGLARMERVVKERMTIQDTESITPQMLVNIRPVQAAIKEFFGSSQLSQFMDQNNPLAELTHKRRLSALGPGGLSRDRAGFEVRDVHHSHYGRMCPIETPEGPNIGLIGSLAIYARINEYGFIETPYRRVENCRVLDEIDYLVADEEDKHVIAQANEPVDENGYFISQRVNARHANDIFVAAAEDVTYMDVSAQQLISVATALIPFLEHDDANRALMGANMQRQAVPLLVTEAPFVGTGMEIKAGLDSGVCEIARADGIISRVCGDEIVLRRDDGELEVHHLQKFKRSNQGTCVNQKPIVKVGQRVQAGEPIADGPSTDHGELSLGRNALVAFMTWEGYNYEDAVLLSEELVKNDVYTSIHIEEYECDARDTKLGPEEITREIPNVGDDILKDLDENGIIRIGAEVRPGDILVGKVTPKGETELTAEERLLRAIFGEKAREVRDTSLRVPHGEAGMIVDVKTFDAARGDELPPGVHHLVRIYIAQKRKISVGDKMAGRHGNKGVVSRVLPQEDMPFLPDGTPVQIVLNPLGVPSRMNIGQILETHLGMAAKRLGLRVATPVFDGANDNDIADILAEAGMREDAKTILYDGRTGEPFDSPVTVGYMYYLKLHHLVDDKIHARSTGPYSLVTQQPLGGKAQFGGQRFGEMEVWALEAYGAAYTLQEILTVKSDDITGRVRTYEAIVKGENVPEPGIPESFKVLIRELQSLCLGVDILDKNNEIVDIREEDEYNENVAETARELDLDIGQGEGLGQPDDGEYEDDDLDDLGDPDDDYDEEVDLDMLPTASELDQLEREMVQYKVDDLSTATNLADLDTLTDPDDYSLDLDD